MHPCIHARTNPDKPAVIVAETGEIHTYMQLDEASNRAAQFFRSHGLKAEDVVAFMVENTPAFYDLTWGAQRSGLRYVCLSTRLTADEADYILENSERLFVMSAGLALWLRNFRLTSNAMRWAIAMGLGRRNCGDAGHPDRR